MLASTVLDEGSLGNLNALVERQRRPRPGTLPGQLNIYAHIMATGHTTLVNSNAAGNALPIEPGTMGVLSADGQYAAFETYNPGTNYPRIYVKHLATGVIQLANISGTGGPSDYDATLTSISADGQTVAFDTDDPTIGGGGMVMRNLDTGVVTSIVSGGALARISSGANYSVWDSDDSNLVPGDTNMAIDTFWRQLN
jgi:Tol biopolymer transport system component